MRALWVAAFTLCLLLFCFPTSAEETDFNWQDQGDGTVIITKWTGTGDQVTVPETLDGKTVIGIGYGVFANKPNLTVCLPDGLTTFQSDSFGNAPNTVKRIECHIDSTTARSLVSRRFFDPDIPDLQFYWYRNTLQLVGYMGGSGEVQVPNLVQTIGTGVFKEARNISVILPESVTQVLGEAFAGGSSVVVYLPDHIIQFGNNAFGASVNTWATVYCNPESDTAQLLTCPFRAPEAPDCILRWMDDALTIVDVETDGAIVSLPSTDVVIPAETMEKLSCHSLPVATRIVENEAFRNCRENRIIIPAGIESIGAYAFADNPNLVMIRFPSGEISIDDTCLSNCPHVTVYAPAGSAALLWAQRNRLNTVAE